MNMLVIVLSVLVGIVLLLLVIALFVRKDYHVQRDIVINRSVSDVFKYIRFLKNQDYYSKWVMTDPNMKKTFTGTDGSVGFIYAWDGNKKAGQGEQEIKNIIENERIDLEIRFIRPFAGIAIVPLTVQAAGNDQTKVTWAMSSSMKYPANIMLLFLNMDNLLGKDLDISLSNLKRILENKS